MKATFMPRSDLQVPEADDAIKILIIDETGLGVEIRIHEGGSVTSRPMTDDIKAFRMSCLWEEVLDDPRAI
jgi:hypothetical protein